MKSATITGRELWDAIKAGHNARAIGLDILGRMIDEDDCEGDSAASNFGLAIFEQALDWAVGIEAVKVIEAYARMGKRPKALRFTISRGDVSVAHANSGRPVWAAA